MEKFSKAQTRALLHLYNFGNGRYTNTTPVTQKCLNVLSEKGYVNVAYDTEHDLGWCETLTEEGKKVAKALWQKAHLDGLGKR